jgi:hypothetical protein
MRLKYIFIIFAVVFVNYLHSNEPINILQDILIINFPGYFYENDDCRIIGNIFTNSHEYTIFYNRHFWGNGRMTGRLVLFEEFNIIGHYGVINETPEIANNKIVFKDIKYNGDTIDFENGIPEKILIDGELHFFEHF